MDGSTLQALLTAYDPDFTGLTSLSTMAQPLEPSADLGPEPRGSVLGGTLDPDGYYDDFTAHLDRFVSSYPRLVAPARGRPGAVGGGTGWGALVISVGRPRGDPEDGAPRQSPDTPACQVCRAVGAEQPAPLRDFVVDAWLPDARLRDASAEHEGADEDAGAEREDGRVGGYPLAPAPLEDGEVRVPGGAPGDADPDASGGEMDESTLEADTFHPLPARPSARGLASLQAFVVDV